MTRATVQIEPWGAGDIPLLERIVDGASGEPAGWVGYALRLGPSTFG